MNNMLSHHCQHDRLAGGLDVTAMLMWPLMCVNSVPQSGGPHACTCCMHARPAAVAAGMAVVVLAAGKKGVGRGRGGGVLD